MVTLEIFISEVILPNKSEIMIIHAHPKNALNKNIIPLQLYELDPMEHSPNKVALK